MYTQWEGLRCKGQEGNLMIFNGIGMHPMFTAMLFSSCLYLMICRAMSKMVLSACQRAEVVQEGWDENKKEI